MSADLHVHLYGCLAPKDIFELAKDRKLDPARIEFFKKTFKQTFGRTPAVDRYFEIDSGLENIQEDYLVTKPSSFAEFQARFNLIIALFPMLPNDPYIIDHVLKDQLEQNIRHREYRCGLLPGFGSQETAQYYETLLKAVQRAKSQSGDSFEAKIIISFDRTPQIFNQQLNGLISWLDAHPEAHDYFVGIDLCQQEAGHPPSQISQEIDRVHQYNTDHRESSLAILYHVGEQFDFLYPESSVRWVYEAWQAGAHRLGHAISLGISPNHFSGLTLTESSAEQVAHLNWLLKNSDWLDLDQLDETPSSIQKKIDQLKKQGALGCQKIGDSCEADKLNYLQIAVMNKLSQQGAIVESCPTSNTLLSGLSTQDPLPWQRFAEHKIETCLGTDDPGIFNTTLGNEWGIFEKDSSHSSGDKSQEKYFAKALSGAKNRCFENT